MIEKYQTHINDIYEYIHNRLQTEVDLQVITDEVLTKYKPYIYFPVKHDILYELVYRLVDQAYYHVNKTFYKV